MKQNLIADYSYKINTDSDNVIKSSPASDSVPDSESSILTLSGVIGVKDTSGFLMMLLVLNLKVYFQIFV